MKNTEKTMDQIVALCKGRGFVYPGSEIYGGLANSWDYGPLGVELKNNVKRAWWKKFVQENPYNVGLDAAILMNPEVWVASGHVSTFNDPLIDCKACKMRHRADKLIEGWCAENGRDDVNVEAMTNEELVAFIRDNGVTSDEFCERFLMEEKVAVISGSAFGPGGEGFIRCCYATSMKDIAEALTRMDNFLTNLRKKQAREG